MLTTDFLKTIAQLNNLTPEQLSAIATASKNDEDVIIGRKVSDIHNQYDQDIKEVLGVDKPGGMKTYEHLKTQLTSLKSKADSAGSVGALQAEIQALKTESESLKSQIAAGSTDEALKTELNSIKQQLTDKNSELTIFKSTAEAEKKTLQESLNKAKATALNFEVNQSIDSHLIEKKIGYKTTIPEGTRNAVIEFERKAILNEFKPDYITTEAGGQKLVFRNQAGEIVRNEQNLNEPATAAELFLKRHSISAMIDEGRIVNGAGSGAGGAGGAGTAIDLSGVTNQTQADDRIRNHIATNEGIAKTDVKFVERHQELREEHNVANMDVR